MSPPSSRATRRAIERPSPAPGLSVEWSRVNSPNTSSRFSAGMPGPSSVTWMASRPASAPSRRSSISVATSIWPPAGVYLIAFDRRFPSTCVTRAGSVARMVFDFRVEMHQRQPRRLGGRAMVLDRVVHDVVQHDAVEVHGELAGLGARELEQVLDQRHQRTRGAADAGEAVALLGGERAAHLVFQQLGMPVDRVDGVLEVVAHAAHEPRAGHHRLRERRAPLLGRERVEMGAA